ncbi:AAA family ATPase [Flavobacterium sp.]|uniref:ATP-dependent nuclease n=1 Tax=Flavobacterium sp. TaxID=239 RepID=UPI00286F1295|nr:AAA family ATPase [Flavobacterium sp.]
MIIKEIRIRNFRSIVKADISLSNLSVIVGFNDVGKSNILKALNLFFNNETDYGSELIFQNDYSKFSPIRNKKAEEIIVEIVLHAPTNYKQSKDIVWRKVWRKNGLHLNDKKFIDGSKFPQKSKLYSWLDNIRYSYIPAIRDIYYFEFLLAKLHDSLAETIEQELRNAGDDFITKIKSNTVQMIQEIDNRLKIKSQIKLPSNLQSLFKALDFSTEEGAFEISISNRGDGIKTRYIPIILKFISEQLNINKTKGSANINMIWGYEEPENNLEMLAAFKLAKDFIDYSKEIQILITTHSPGFYNLKDNYNENVSLFKVIKEKNKEAEIKELLAYNELDNDMGIMPLIAPYVKEKVKEIEHLQEDIIKYKNELSNIDKNTIFVEGDDEVRIFTEILKHFKIEDNIKISKDGLGCSGVKNQIMAWAWVSGITTYRAIGVFDNDTSGISEFNKLKDEKQFNVSVSSQKVKALQYKVPSHLINIKSKINNFPIELEEMYPPKVWEIAKSKGWLEQRELLELNSFVTVDNLFQNINEKIETLGFDDNEKLYVQHKIPDKFKEKISKFLVNDKTMSIDDKFSSLIKIFQESIIPFLTK